MTRVYHSGLFPSYREQVGVPLQRSILSLSSSHEVNNYDEIARTLDANLAQVEMDDFHSHDIHSVLSTLHNDLQVGQKVSATLDTLAVCSRALIDMGVQLSCRRKALANCHRPFT